MVIKFLVWLCLLLKRPREAGYHVYAKFCHWRWRSFGFHRVGELDFYVTSMKEALKEITQQPSTLIRSIMERTYWPNNFYDGAIPHSFNASMELVSLCYAICRLLKPSKVVETGVANGLTSFSILRALKENGSGQLYSIELPPLQPGAESWVGHLVPEFLRSQWILLFGASQYLLPQIPPVLEPIDVFVHDSDHSYWNQLREYRFVWPYLRPGGVLISHDVVNDALIELAEEEGTTPFIVRQSRPGFIGILVKPISQDQTRGCGV